MDSITADELYQHVEVLADDVYEGRAAGSRGGRAAAQYLVKQLQPYSFTPAGSGGDYVQRFGNGWQNVLVLLPGDDPDLQREVIVVGAHYDHVGYGNRSNSYGPIGRIHNGADDNASGIAVLLETMEAFATSGLRTRRSILFALWDGEERGLVGSRHWLANPTLSVDRVKLAITIDMVGRLRGGRLYVLGTRSGYGLRRLMSGPVEDPLWLDFSWELHDNSDHWPFLERRVPVALLHTGLHRDYHRPSDDVEKINREGMREVSRYLLAVLLKVANEDRLPQFRGRVTRETDGMRRTLEQPLAPASLQDWPAHRPPPRLGISWREDDAERGSVFLTRVVDGTPAAAAGLAVHDRIYELNGQAFADAAAFESAITALLDSGQPEFTMLTERRGHVRTITVKMPSSSQEPRVESQEPAASGS
ncbi:MAG: M20/M25/M40 family metallo-hydrolase [Pirellulales bacterium]